MKKKRICLLLIILSIFLFKIDVNAAGTCTKDEKQILQIEANNVLVDYELSRPENSDYISAKSYFYTVKIENLTENLYLKIGANTYDKTKANVNGSLILKDIFVGGGINAKVIIYSKTANCSNILLRTVTLKLPYYNTYSEREECIGLSSYGICTKNSNTEDIDEETFLEKIDEAKKMEAEKNKPKEPVEEENNMLEDIFEYLKENYKTIIIASVIIVILIVGITKLIKKKNKNKIKIDFEK